MEEEERESGRRTEKEWKKDGERVDEGRRKKKDGERGGEGQRKKNRKSGRRTDKEWKKDLGKRADKEWKKGGEREKEGQRMNDKGRN